MKWYSSNDSYILDFNGIADPALFIASLSKTIIEKTKQFPKNNVLDIESDTYMKRDINLLQILVEIVYEYVQFHVKIQKRPILSGMLDFDEKTVCQALELYNIYKNKVQECHENLYGKGFGSKTGFALKDWTDLNEKYLKLFL